MEVLRLTSSLRDLYGRKKELKSLHTALIRAQGHDEVQTVFVGGESGCGKSTLVYRAFRNERCLFGYGKFPQTRDSQPFSVISAVFGGLINAVLNSNDAPKYRDLLNNQLTSEDISVIFKFVRGVSRLCTDTDPKVTPDLAAKQGRDRLKYSLRRLLCALALADCPVVICVDDLQWACDATLDIFQSIVTNSNIKSALFVGCYRDNEIEQNPAAAKWIQEIMDNPVKQTKKLILSNISAPDISLLLSDLLNNDIDADTRDLAALIHNRTNGNIFHVLQMIDYIQTMGLIVRSLLERHWTWDLVRIREETILSENVVRIVTAKMEALSNDDALACLKIAACLGFRFNESVLKLVVSHLGIEEESANVKLCLNVAVDQGLLERLNDDRLKFVHDKVYYAALQLLQNDQQRSNMHFNIGTILWDHYISQRKISDSGIDVDDLDDRNLFLCVDQLNHGCHLIDDYNFWVKLAKLNLQAAKRVATYSAFLPGVKYLKDSIYMLKKDSNSWIHHYALLLEIYSSLVEMLFAAGQLTEADQISNEILANSKSINDTIRAHMIKIQIMSAQSKNAEAVQMSLDVLDELGEHLPRYPSKLQRLMYIQKTKWQLSHMTDDEILSLPRMTDEAIIASLQILAVIIMAVYQSQNYTLFSIISCRMVQLTLQHGLSTFSPDGFVLMSYQINTGTTMDVDTGIRLWNLTYLLIDALNLRHRIGAITPHAMHCHQLKTPHVMTLDKLIEGHEISMKNGDLHHAYLNITGYLVHYFYSGLPMKPLLQDLQRYLQQMEEYNVHSFYMWNRPVHETVLCLTGNFEMPQTNTNASCGLANALKLKFEEMDLKFISETVLSYTMQVAYYFGEMDLALETSKKLQQVWPFGVVFGSYIGVYAHARVFFFCLIAIWHYKATNKPTKKLKYKREAANHLRIFRNWVKEGRINCAHKLLILEAEMQTIGPRLYDTENLQKAYNTAIASSTRAGFLQDAAVVNYLAGIQFRLDDPFASNHYIRQAYTLYLVWGAKAISDHIECTFPAIFAAEKDLLGNSESSGFRSRQRFNRTLSIGHKTMPAHLNNSLKTRFDENER